MTTDELKAALKAAHGEHVAGFSTRFHSVEGLKMVVLADQTRDPIYAEAVILDTVKNKLSSVAFSYPLGQDHEATWRDMQGFIEAWHADPDADWAEKAQSGETRANSVEVAPAANIVRRLGLFKRDPDVGNESYEILRMGIEQKHGADADAILDRTKFVAFENARLQRSLSEFAGALKIHADAFSSLQALEDFTWRELEFYGRLDKRGGLRRQAAKTYPILARFFANNSNFTRQVIEREQSLNEALAASFKIKEASLKRLNGKTWSSHGLRDAELLQALSDIPPDWFPKTEQDWESFCILIKTVGREIAPLFEDISDKPLDVLFKGAKGNWREFHERCATSFLDTRPPQGLDQEIGGTLMKRTDFKGLAKAKAASEEEFLAKREKEMERFTIQSDEVRSDALAWMARCVDAYVDTPAPADLDPKIAKAAMQQADFGGLWRAKCASPEEFAAKIERDLAGFEVKGDDVRAAMHEWMQERVVAIFGTEPPSDLSREISSPLMTRLDFEALKEARASSQKEFDDALKSELGRFAIELEDMQDATREWMERRVTPDLSEDNMKLAANSTRDMVTFVRNHLVIPAAALAADNLGNIDKIVIRAHQRRKCAEVAARLLFLPDSNNAGAGKAITNIFESTRSFLNDMGRITRSIFDESLNLDIVDVPQGHWPKLFNGQVETPVPGFYFEALTSEEQLIEEAKALSHCVDGYGPSCRNGGHIIAFRKRTAREDNLGHAHKGYQHIGTMEIIAPERRGAELLVRQFFGRGNGYFSPATRRLKDWLLMRLNNDQIKVNWDTIDAFQSGRKDAIPNEVHRICGYNWKKEKDVSKALGALKGLLHKSVTKEAKNAGDLIEHDVMLSAIGAVDMIYGAEAKAAARAPAM